MHGALGQVQIPTIVIVAGASWRFTRLERVAASDWGYILILEADLRLLEIKLYRIWLDDAVCIVFLCNTGCLLLLIGVVSAERCL